MSIKSPLLSKNGGVQGVTELPMFSGVTWFEACHLPVVSSTTAADDAVIQILETSPAQNTPKMANHKKLETGSPSNLKSNSQVVASQHDRKMTLTSNLSRLPPCCVRTNMHAIG
eukprot:GHVT01009181.1.p3 GENE.GHVT01009181.1~~GHVT01009181.1.p3  ORF type:complete len:114 (+),score=12.38 GHVT01009181.1:559-900(+)